MKYLIAISTCHSFEENGCNQAVRDTWLPDCKKYGVDYKFFVGHGECGFGRTNTSAINPYPFGSSNGYKLGDKQPEDTVQLDCGDGYNRLTYKTQESLKWAAERGYDYVFRCFPDTYVHVGRLLASGFHRSDYHGDFRGELLAHPNYTSGGAGYWLSKKAYFYLLGAPILGVWRDDLTVYVEDLWVGRIISPRMKDGTFLQYAHDPRYMNRGQVYQPHPSNNFVTAHLSCGGGGQGTVPYTKDLMYKAHDPWRKP